MGPDGLPGAAVLSGNTWHQTVEQGTDAIAHPATIGAGGPTGAFFDRVGDVSW